MQNFKNMLSSDIIKERWIYIKDNDDTIRSNNSGVNAPIDVPIGALWFCTQSDSQVLYCLTGTDGGVKPTAQQQYWKPIVDLKLDDPLNVVVDRGTLANVNMSFDDDSYKQNGVYKVAPSTWEHPKSLPSHTVYNWSTRVFETENASNNGVLAVMTSGDNILQFYADAENSALYMRTHDDDARTDSAGWKPWGRTWTDKNLTKLSQLQNDGNGKPNSKYLVLGDITKSVLESALSYTPLDSSQVCAGGSHVPSWKNIAPVINEEGVMHIGRYIKFHPSSGSSVVTITLDAGTSSTDRILSVYGSTSGDAASILASNDVIGFSDERLKSQIKVIGDAVNKVKQIRGVTFIRKDLPKGSPRQTGVIAQDVQKVLPEAVRAVVKPDSTTEFLTVAYGNMIGLLIEAIKEQQTMIDKLAEKCGVELSTPKRLRKTVRKKSAKKGAEQ